MMIAMTDTIHDKLRRFHVAQKMRWSGLNIWNHLRLPTEAREWAHTKTEADLAPTSIYSIDQDAISILF
jgi:hypothetical protein